VQVLLVATVPPTSEMFPEPAAAVAVPPQVFVSPLGVATTIPTGNVSVNATPVSATAFAAGLVIVKVSEVVPFSGIFAAPNALAIDGGETTLTLADAVPPVPPSVEVTLPVVLFFVPAAVPVTLTAKVHDVLPARVAPVRLTKFAPAAEVIVPPPQLPVKPFGVATTNPAGNVSVNPTPVRVDVALLFWIVNVSEVVPFRGTLAAPNALIITGGATTVMLAFVVFPVPPSIDVTCVLLFLIPPVVPVLFTVIVHEVFGASVAPVRLTTPDPETAVVAPEQVLVNPFGVETTKPAGRLSVNAIPVSGIVFTAGFVIVNVKLVEPFKGIVAAPNALVIVGGAATVRFAVAVLPVPPFVEVTVPVVFTN
jgi:hypothetical protein